MSQLTDPRKEFGRAVTAIAADNDRIVVLSADSGKSSGFGDFAKAYPERYFEFGIMEQGVTVIDPATTYIDKQVRIGKDSIIHPFTMLTGKVEIGEECIIGPHAQIADSKVGSGSHLQFCYVQEAELGNRVLVGPYALVRPGSRIADDTHIGTFVEVTRSRIGRGCDILHLSYIGDACIGDRVSLGTGTVTVNFDGTARRPTLIGDDVFLGSNTQLIAPVDVPSGVRYAHNAVLTGKVDQDTAPEDNGASDKVRRRRKKPAAL